MSKMSTITTNPRSTAALPETVNAAGEERHVVRGRHLEVLRLPYRCARRTGVFSGRLRRRGHRDHDPWAETRVVPRICWACLSTLSSTELEIDCEDLGSTTWKRPELGRGVEADL